MARCISPTLGSGSALNMSCWTRPNWMGSPSRMGAGQTPDFMKAHSTLASPDHDAAEPHLQLSLPGIRKLRSGKVREVFDLQDCLLMVATDRISAFDCIMPNGIPGKGELLTQVSHFWFDQLD